MEKKRAQEEKQAALLRSYARRHEPPVATTSLEEAVTEALLRYKVQMSVARAARNNQNQN